MIEYLSAVAGRNVSDGAIRLLCDNWRPSSAKRYDAAWAKFKDFLRARHVGLDQINLDSNRPPSRRMFQSWNVTSVFEKLPPPDTFVIAQRRCAFLLAMASSRRPSEIASLKCSTAFMTISADKVRFIPSRLSKTDRQNHLGPAIVINRLPSPSPQSPCPVVALESLLLLRISLNIAHDHIFSMPHPPFVQIDVGHLSSFIKECFRHAGASAPPGSTRSISVSDAFAKGASID